jgi:hypothetical protein
MAIGRLFLEECSDYLNQVAKKTDSKVGRARSIAEER